MTYRPDVAPADLRAAAEAERIEAERRRDARPSLRSMPMRYVGLDEVDAAPVTPYEIVAQQAAERSFFACRGILWPGSQATKIGVDTQPPAMDVQSWAEANLARPPVAARSGFEDFVSFSMRYLAASVDLPYEEFTRDWRDVSEASERARLTERIRDRCLIVSTPPMGRAEAERFNAAIGSGDWHAALAAPRSPGNRT